MWLTVLLEMIVLLEYIDLLVMFNGGSLETLPQLISLMRKYLFHIPYLARDNYSDYGYWHERNGS